MKQGKKTRPEQVALMLRQLEEPAQGKSLALAYRKAKISEWSSTTST